MILVTGATGHLGNNFLRTLLQAEAKKGAAATALRIFVPPGERLDCLDGLSFELCYGDIRRAEDLDRACQGVDYVYHLAGLVDIAPKNDQALKAINVLGTRNVVEACLRHGVRRLVYVSSIHALPDLPKDQTIRELDARAFPNPDLLGPYARSKSEATAEVYRGVAQGLDAVLIFPTGIIGPGDYRASQFGKVLLHLLHKRRARRLFCFEGAYDFVDVRDVSQAILAAMERGRSGEGYIISGHRLSIAELYKTVFSFLGRQSVKLIFLPLRLVRFAASLVLRLARICHRKPFFTPYSIDVLKSNSQVDHSKAQRELGYRPRPIQETLEETLAWLYQREALELLHSQWKASRRRRSKARKARLRRLQGKLEAARLGTSKQEP